MAIAPNNKRNQVLSAIPKAQYDNVAHKRVIEMTFARRGMALYSRKLRIYVPKYLDSTTSHTAQENYENKERPPAIKRASWVTTAQKCR